MHATQSTPARQHSSERRGCPNWCTNADCDGDHLGEDAGTLATAGRPPAYSGTYESRPRYDTVSVIPQHPEADGLHPSVQLLTVTRDDDVAAELTADEARRLGEALIAAADLVDGRPGTVWPPAGA